MIVTIWNQVKFYLFVLFAIITHESWIKKTCINNKIANLLFELIIKNNFIFFLVVASCIPCSFDSIIRFIKIQKK